MILLLGLIVSLALHLLLGWQWTLAAAILTGIVSKRLGWLYGALVVALDYILLTFWSFVNAGAATAGMVETMGGLLGNLSGPAVVAVSLTVAGVIGLLGGLIGGILRSMFDHLRPPQTTT